MHFQDEEHQHQNLHHPNDVSDLNLEDLNLGGGSDEEPEDQDEVQKMKKMIEKKSRVNLW